MATDGGLLSAPEPTKVTLLALDRGNDVEDFMGKDNAELNAPCDASRSNFVVDFNLTVSSNRTAQHARWISTEKRRVKSSATTRASATTCRNPKRGKRDGFGVVEPTGTFICENELKDDGVGEVTMGMLAAVAAFELDEIFDETEVTDGMTCWRRCSHLNFEGDRGGGDVDASTSNILSRTLITTAYIRLARPKALMFQRQCALQPSRRSQIYQ